MEISGQRDSLTLRQKEHGTEKKIILKKGGSYRTREKSRIINKERTEGRFKLIEHNLHQGGFENGKADSFL